MVIRFLTVLTWTKLISLPLLTRQRRWPSKQSTDFPVWLIMLWSSVYKSRPTKTRHHRALTPYLRFKWRARRKHFCSLIWPVSRVLKGKRTSKRRFPSIALHWSSIKFWLRFRRTKSPFAQLHWLDISSHMSMRMSSCYSTLDKISYIKELSNAIAMTTDTAKSNVIQKPSATSTPFPKHRRLWKSLVPSLSTQCRRLGAYDARLFEIDQYNAFE